jgi:ubiquinol-cytochrome c reductase cytochrome c subunit
MAFSAMKLFYDRLPMIGRAERAGVITRHFFSAAASGEKSGECNQAKDPQAATHTKVGCIVTSPSFSQDSQKAERTRTRLVREGTDTGIQGYVACKWSMPSIWRYPGAVLGLFLATCISVPTAFAQPGVMSGSPDGKQIFEQHCTECHGQQGQGISAAVTYAGPSLQAEHDPGEVMTAIETGPEHMPRFEYVLSAEQMRAVTQYVTEKLAVIPLTGGSLTDGGELFRTYCASCHRTAVRGGALGFVGTNAPSLENKSAAIIAGAIRWGPGPMPSFPSAVLNDEQVASIVRYIRVVQHPASPGGNPLKWYGPTSEGFAAWIFLLVLILFATWVERGGEG